MDGSRIKEITSEGLTYLNEQDEDVFIDFADCFQRQLGRYTTPEALKTFKEVNHKTDEQVQNWVAFLNKHKVVGGRHIGGFRGRLWTIAFYTEPLTEFEFSSEQAWGQVVYAIKKAGWRTEDWA
ncbi:MAG: hypothetical protein ABI700_16645 [Chloroflexota bacterium]